MAKNNKKYIKSILFGRHLQEKGFVSKENIKYFSKGAIYKKKDSNNIKIIKFQFQVLLYKSQFQVLLYKYQFQVLLYKYQFSGT